MSYSTGVIKLRKSTAQGAAAPVSPADPDFVLLQRIAAQDQDALQSLYEKHAPSLLHYLAGRVGDTRLAEELLQDTMLAAWQNAAKFRGECRVRTWLITIARRRAINAYHRQLVPASRNIPLESTAQSPSPQPGAPGQYTDLNAALQTLPAEQRETLELVFYHGLSLEETARVLQVAPGTVKSRLHRARGRLRTQMADGRESNE